MRELTMHASDTHWHPKKVDLEMPRIERSGQKGNCANPTIVTTRQ